MCLLWIIAGISAYHGPASLLAEKIEGVDMSMVPIWPSIVFLLAALGGFAATIHWVLSLRKPATARDSSEPGFNDLGSQRRSLLLGAVTLLGAGAGIGSAALSRLYGWRVVDVKVTGPEPPRTAKQPLENWQDAHIVSYRDLGSTGFKVSDISFGTSSFLRHPDPVRYLREALDRGINYIDTSPDYAGTTAEQAIGKAIAGRHRDELFVATKWCTGDGHIRQGASVATYMRAIEDSLARLRTDHVDLVHVHACDSIERLLDPNVHEAFDRLKDQGKVRFMGVSTHTPNLEEVARSAIDSRRFDVMMLAYHHGAWPLQTQLIEEAAAKGIGIVAMKTLKGAKHRGLLDFRPEADSFTQAAFKWVLANRSVSCLVISFFENQHLDEYLYASGKSLTEADIAILEHYDELIAGTHCFVHCGSCLDSCPVSLPINDVLRYRMYFEDYGDQKQAMQLYAKLDRQADACATCSAPCIGTCPSGIDIKARMTGAHNMLRLSQVSDRD